MSQANFMRNIRMTFPQYVTNVTSFDDSVKILKNKGILNEIHQPLPEKPDQEEATNDSDAEFDAILKKLEDEKTGEEAVKSQYDLEEELPASHTDLLTAKKIVDKYYEMFGKNPQTTFADVAKALGTDEEHVAVVLGLTASGFHEGINEAKKAEKEGYWGQNGKEQHTKFTDINNANGEEVFKGMKVEHECFPDKTYEEIEKIVLKNIKKNANYYTNFLLTGIRDYQLDTMDKTNTPDVMAMKPVKDGNLVDQKRGMKKVKMVKEAMEVNPEGNLQPQGFPTAPDVDRILRFMKANKTFLNLLKSLNSIKEFTDFFRELLQLTGPELDALKVSDTQLQSIFRKAVLDKRKEDGVPNQIFSKNANIQKGINDIGGIKEAEVPQDDKVEAELASALSQQPTLKRILQKVDLPQEINGTIKALLDRTNLKNVPDQIILAALRKVLNDQPGPTFTAQYAANANVGKPNPKLGKTLKEKLTSMVREMLAEEEVPSKKKAASEITAKAVDAIDDHNEGEGKEYKKKWLEDIFDSYEDKVGHRYDDSVFEDVIDMLKAKGYTMTMKEMYDGRDNMTDVTGETN